MPENPTNLIRALSTPEREREWEKEHRAWILAKLEGESSLVKTRERIEKWLRD